jgi:hypothetical protein
MQGFIDEIGDFAGDFLGGISDRFSAGGETALAVAERIRVNNQIAAAEAQRKAEASREIRGIISTVVYIALALFAAWIVTNIVIKINKG